MLSNPQQISFQKLYSKGSSRQDKKLSDSHIRALLHIAATDLGISSPFGEVAVPGIFSNDFNDDLVFGESVDSRVAYEQVLALNPNAETYVACLAQIVRARLKYVRVLRSQPLATMDQVGPRSLLQFGTMGDAELASLLVWRKWLFDIDNRAAQDTGYLFEPVIAGAIGGVPYGHKTSPIRRLSGKGARQVDAIKGSRAYEFKIRITIAASGHGRWSEELSFPKECVLSGYTPVLIVLDSTPNPKLNEISEAYREQGGEVYTGDAAWNHLRSEAGDEMGVFLKRYVEKPLTRMVEEEKNRLNLLPLKLEQAGGRISLIVGSESQTIERDDIDTAEDEDTIPDDAGSFLPGTD